MTDTDDFVPGRPASLVEKTFGAVSDAVLRLGVMATGDQESPAATRLTLKRIKEARDALDKMEVAALAQSKANAIARREANAERTKSDRAMVRHLIKNPNEIARAEALGLKDVAAAARAALNIPAPEKAVEAPVVVPIRKGLIWGLGRKVAA